MASLSSRFRHVVLTLNATDDHSFDPRAWYDQWKAGPLPSELTYLCFQLEEGGNCERLHVQGYAELSKQMRWKALQELLGCKGAHFEARNGTPAQAIEYTKKPETAVDKETRPWVEHGKPSGGQGKRNDLLDVVADINAGLRLSEIAVRHPTTFIRNSNGIARHFALVNKPKARGKPEIYYIHGPPNCNKSRWASLRFPEAFWAEESKEGWFDGYEGEQVVVFDDFEGTFPFQQMKRLVDWYKLRNKIKGGTAAISATVWVFTSQLPHTEWYKGHGEHAAAMHAAWLSRFERFDATVVNMHTEEGKAWMEEEMINLLSPFDEPAPQPADPDAQRYLSKMQARAKDHPPARPRSASPAPTEVFEDLPPAP